MHIRGRKYLSVLIFGVAIFIFTYTIPKQDSVASTNNDKTRKKSFKTKTTVRRLERRYYWIRGKNAKETTYRQIKYFSSSKGKGKPTISNQELIQVKVQPRNSPHFEKHFPTVIILGVKKAGTRALLEALQMHPKVVGAPDEVYFFNGFHSRGLEWYRQKMPMSSPDQMTIEKSPTYFTSVEKTQVVNRMFVFSRSTRKPLKLLVVVRDPTTRCLSEYTDLIARSRKDEIPPVNTRFESFVMDKHGSVNATSSLVKTGLYINHLRQWLEYFPPNELHFVSGEYLVKNPYKEIKAVEKFLELEPFFTENNFKFEKRKGFPCFVPDASDTSRSYCLPPNKGRKHARVQPRTLQLLREFYRPYNEEFYKKVQRNFFWS